MIRYAKGDLLAADVEALVNAVNTVGVMGKGIALLFKQAFPENFLAYEEPCRRGTVEIGRMLVTETGAERPRWIINFPTKKDWRLPSELEYVEQGLSNLVRVIQEKGIKSIAMPALGCGLGGLDWERVRPMIERTLADVPEVDAQVYEPGRQ